MKTTIEIDVDINYHVEKEWPQTRYEPGEPAVAVIDSVNIGKTDISADLDEELMFALEEECMEDSYEN